MLPLREPAPLDPGASEDENAARDLAACRQLLASGSKSFAMASWLLPSRLRDAATGLYAFCRVADDLIDLTGKAEAGSNWCGCGSARSIAASRFRIRRIEPLPAWSGILVFPVSRLTAGRRLRLGCSGSGL